MRRRFLLASTCLCLASASLAAFPGHSAGRDLRDVIGVTHTSGKYHFTNADFLNEGADRILKLGSRVVKLWCLRPEKCYPFHSEWPSCSSLTEMMDTTYFRAVFDKPFTTYVLVVYSLGRPEHYWREGITPEQAADEERQFHDLASHLIKTYRGTRKTFILQHWEGDWAIRGHYESTKDPTETAIHAMAEWLNARQAGVNRARAENPTADVRVFHAAEVNLVARSLRDGRPGVVNRVLPNTRLDLVSYSSWDTGGDRANFREALGFIAENMPDSQAFGSRNVFIGEFGLPENEFPQEKFRDTIRGVVETSLEWGCPYVIYWELYCNEPKKTPVISNDDCRGFWLIRPDGSKSWAWDHLQSRMGIAAGGQ